MAATQRTRTSESVTSAELDRAIRLMSIRSRRQATGLFAGNYASAFRGGGLEFEESRPYVPGDDVRNIDWVTTARSGEPYIKCFREERNHTLVFALDLSASMRFGSAGESKAGFATRAIALLAAAASRAGDRTALVLFDARVRRRMAPGRGRAHTWNLIRAAAIEAAHPDGVTHPGEALRTLRGLAVHRPTVFLFSDFRDVVSRSEHQHEWIELARRCDLVAAPIVDPLEDELPAAGPVRIEDPERPEAAWVIDTGSRRTRQRYERAAADWRHRTQRWLRGRGAEVLWLRCGRDPLFALGRFFEERAKRRHRMTT